MPTRARFVRAAAIMLAAVLPGAVAAPGPYTLHYDKPASTWTEALPVGNGRLGAMVFGDARDELLQLNEATLWSGGPVGQDVNPDAFAQLAPARAALAAGDSAGAAKILRKMQGPYTEGYLPLADLRIHQETPAATDYYRDLDIRNGVATTTFSADGVRYKREVFASHPGQLIVVRLSADRPRQLSLDVAASSQLRAEARSAGKAIVLRGKAPAHVDPSYYKAKAEPIVYEDPAGCRGMRFETAVQPRVTDGTVEAQDGVLRIRGASEVLLLVSAATSFNGFDKCPDSAGKDEHALASQPLRKAAGTSYDKLLAEHLADVHGLFDRVGLDLGGLDRSALPTDRRLEDYARGGQDPQLEALYFQFGRYLLMSSSRTPDAPANLQGIWNKDVRAPWSSNYTTNINVQMNYWPVEAANLGELFAPLDGLIRHLAVTGGDTSRSFYHLPGWVVHHNSDIWAASNPVGEFGAGDPKWANWYMGSAWLSRHLWEHYQYTGDKRYLESAYPVMKGAAEFMLGWLQDDGQGRLVTSPSTSPENVFYYDGADGKKQGSVTVGSTMDLGIARDLFTNVTAAAETLGVDPGLRARVASAKARLLPFQVGSRGQLQEWTRDFEEVEPHHRHVSQLYALHPAREISPLTTPELARAARRTLELRGDDGTGWSLAWKINFWARLLDGDHAYTLFRNLLRLTKDNDPAWGGHGGAYPNLFDAHPPFQIDGNFAGTAGVIEMLLQSQNGELHLLPALPAAWKTGSVRGLVARGNVVVDMAWRDGALVSGELLARGGGPLTIRTAAPVAIPELKLRSEKSSIGYVLRFTSRKGARYRVVPDRTTTETK